MATTHDTHEDAWAWPCPYCGTSNALESAVCVGCRAQLRDPEEDDLFTTVATDNAQMVDPDAPRIREVLWSTEAPPEDLVVEEVHEPDPFAGGAQPGTLPPGTPVAPQAAGPFSPESPGRVGADNPGAFGPAGSQRSSATPGGEPPTSATPFLKEFSQRQFSAICRSFPTIAARCAPCMRESLFQRRSLLP